MSAIGFNDGALTKEAAADIDANLLATIDGNGKAALCGASGFPFGLPTDDVVTGQTYAFRPFRGRVLVIASAAVNPGEFVKAAAAGQVAPEASVTTLTAFSIGQADTAAAQQGDAFYVIAR